MKGTTGEWESDEGLLMLLQDALAARDCTPSHVKNAAYEAFTWRNIDAELAELAALTEDLGTHAPAGAGATRSTQADVTAVTLSSPSVTFELQVIPGIVLGQMIPAGPRALQLQRLDGRAREVPVDELGCFSLDPAPGVLFRLCLDGEHTVTTSWISLP